MSNDGTNRPQIPIDVQSIAEQRQLRMERLLALEVRVQQFERDLKLDREFRRRQDVFHRKNDLMECIPIDQPSAAESKRLRMETPSAFESSVQEFKQNAELDAVSQRREYEFRQRNDQIIDSSLNYLPQPIAQQIRNERTALKLLIDNMRGELREKLNLIDECRDQISRLSQSHDLLRRQIRDFEKLNDKEGKNGTVYDRFRTFYGAVTE